jgi:hypothetical protein
MFTWSYFLIFQYAGFESCQTRTIGEVFTTYFKQVNSVDG